MAPKDKTKNKKDSKGGSDNSDNETPRPGTNSPNEEMIEKMMEKHTKVLVESAKVQSEKQSKILADQTDKKFTEFTLSLNDTMSANISQVETNTNLKIAMLTSEMEALKSATALSKNDILNSKEISDFIEFSVEKVISKRLEEEKNTISKLRETVKKLESESTRTKDKEKRNNNALNNLSLNSSLCKKVLSVKNCILDKGKTSTFLNSITEKLHNRPVVFYNRDSSKLHLTFNTIHAAREFQREVVKLNFKKELKIIKPLDGKDYSMASIRIEDDIPPALRGSKHSMVSLGSYLKKHKLISAFNIELTPYGTKLTVKGHPKDDPEAAAKWLSTTEDFPVVKDI